MSLQQRAHALSKKYNTPISTYALRKYYHTFGVRKKKISRKMVSIKHESPIRVLQVDQLRCKVRKLMEEGVSIVYLDEAVFSAKGNHGTTWQNPGKQDFLQLKSVD